MGRTSKIKTKDRTLVDPIHESPVDRYEHAKRRRWVTVPLITLLVLAAVGAIFFRQVSLVDVPEDFATDEEHFKYGSIGSDTLAGNGVPYWLWRAMFQVCSDQLPGGPTSLGLIQETGMDRPIGFSKRRTGFFDSVGLNCAVCHTASVRSAPGAKPAAYLAASSHQLDLWGYFNFLFQCGQSPNFNEERVMAAIESMTTLNVLDRFIYRRAIKETPPRLAGQSAMLSWIRERPLWGPGRVDTFNPYRSLIFKVPVPANSIGTADFMTIWGQGIRAGLHVHWDGNNPSVQERNLSAAMGAGATPATVDLDRLARIRKWIWDLPSPRYPFPIDGELAKAGAPLYARHCASCHDPGGKEYGAVTKNAYIGTDPHRSDAFDQTMADLMNRIGEGYPWRFHNFKPTGGYANHPMDGAWLRAPFLHNGSVPTLRDLLNPAAQRPTSFYKGYDVYDAVNMGFVSNVPAGNGRTFYRFDTTLPGNGNGGHEYGVTLTDTEKAALLEYMKTR